MTVTTYQVERSRKRFRQEEPIDDTMQKLSRTDQQTVQEGQRLLNDFIPIQIKDHASSGLVDQFPHAFQIDKVLSTENLATMQQYLRELSGTKVRVLKSWEARVCLLSIEGQCSIKKKHSFQVNILLHDEMNNIFKLLFQKAMEAAYALDDNQSLGVYTGELFVVRDCKADDYPLEGLSLHHDFYRDPNDPNRTTQRFPKYLFVTMLCDRDGRWGWKGGDLIVQNDDTTRPFVTFRKSLPYLSYPYPFNGGLCLRNKNVVHMRSGITGTATRSGKISRDLLIIHLYESKL